MSAFALCVIPGDVCQWGALCPSNPGQISVQFSSCVPSLSDMQRQLREQQGLSKAQLRMGSRDQISHWQDGEEKPAMDLKFIFCHACEGWSNLVGQFASTAGAGYLTAVHIGKMWKLGNGHVWSQFETFLAYASSCLLPWCFLQGSLVRPV